MPHVPALSPCRSFSPVLWRYSETGKLQGVWVEHPFPVMSEPEKRVAYMTDWGDYDAAHLSWLYEMASLHAIDTVFMQIRRRLSLLERAIPTARRARRLWHGRAPYDPGTIGRMLDIYRVWHNGCTSATTG